MPFSACRYTVSPGGRKLATSVGRPIPRFTAMPSRSSFATRMAMSSLVKPTGVMLRPLHDALNVNARRHDELRVQLARLDNLLDLRNRHLRGRRHDGVEVALRGVVHKVAM